MLGSYLAMNAWIGQNLIDLMNDILHELLVPTTKLLSPNL